MTSIWQWTRVCAIAALAVLYAPIASAQAPGEVDPHKDHHSQAAQPSGGDKATKPLGRDMMAGKKDMMARMSALDARIDTLVADMNMFGGELRISAMVSLLSALAERNKVMRDTMMQMHDEMMLQTTDVNGQEASDAEEPGCSMMKHKAAGPQP
jgi:hypothetical protein